MEDQIKDFAKLAVAAGISIPAAKLLIEKYKKDKILRKSGLKTNKTLQDYLPHDMRQDVLDVGADISTRGG